MKKKLISLCLAICLVITLAVPSITASAIILPDEEFETVKIPTDFTLDYDGTDATVFGLGQSSKDIYGNTFYPFKYYQNGTFTKDLKPVITTENGTTMVKLSGYQNSANTQQYIDCLQYVPTDKNGKPFIMEANSTYKVTVKFNYGLIPSNTSIYVGCGNLATKQTVGSSTVTTYGANSKKFDYGDFQPAWGGKFYVYDGVRTSDDGNTVTNNVKYGLSVPVYAANNYWKGNSDSAVDSAFSETFTKTFYVNVPDYTLQNGLFYVQANNSEDGGTDVYNVGYNPYLTITLNGLRYIVNGFQGAIGIDKLECKKLLTDVTFNANGGIVGGSEQAVVKGYSGDALPVPTKQGSYIFDGWYFADGKPAGDVYAAELSGKTVYAHWEEGSLPVTYTFDGNEIITSSGGNKITGIDGNQYSISAWCFQGTSAGYGGGKALRCGAGSQTWGVNGCYPLNDGTSFYYLEPDTCYTVTMDIQAAYSGSNGNFYLVAGPYYSGSGWSTDGTKYKNALVNLVTFTNGNVTFPEAASYKSNGNNWYSVTYKFTTPSEFALTETDFPLPNILALFGSWVSGVTVNYDNITVTKAPSVKFVKENGDVETAKYYIGDTVTLNKINKPTDVIFGDGTGLTSLGNAWYYDKEFTNPVTGSIVLNNKSLTFYEKNNALIPYNNNQVSYYGFEDKIAQSGITLTTGGYNSDTSAKLSNTTVTVGKENTLEVNTSYLLSFYYKSANGFKVTVGDKSVNLAAAASYTKASVAFTATTATPTVKFENVSGNAYADTFIVSKAAASAGSSVLTDAAEQSENAQALRLYFAYNVNNNGKIELNGSEYTVTERGVLFAYANAVNGELTENTSGVQKVSTTNLTSAWSNENGKVVYSTYITGFAKNDTKSVISRGYVKLSDGNTYYTDAQTTSVSRDKKANKYKTEVNSYNLTSKAVRDSVILQERYDVTNSGVTFDWTGATLKFTALCSGEVGVTLKSNVSEVSPDMESYFTVFVDGKRLPTRYHIHAKAEGEENTVYFNVGDKFTNHVIEFAKQYESGHGLFELTKFTVHGELKATAPAKQVIEFIGDSVTCGGCNYNMYDEDGTLAYAFLTARALGVDYQIVSRSGSGLNYDSGAGTSDVTTWRRAYTYENAVRSTSKQLTQERKADIVVIFLGTNDACARDNGASWGDKDFKEGAEILINNIRSVSPNAKIVWCINGMDARYNDSAKYAMKQLGGTSNGLYVFDFTACYHGGGNWHPNSDEHAVMSQTMVTWFNQSGLLK